MNCREGVAVEECENRRESAAGEATGSGKKERKDVNSGSLRKGEGKYGKTDEWASMRW